MNTPIPLSSDLVGETVRVVLSPPLGSESASTASHGAGVVRACYLGIVDQSRPPGFRSGVRLLVQVTTDHAIDDRLIAGAMLDVSADDCLVTGIAY